MFTINWFSTLGTYGCPGDETFEDGMQAVRFARQLKDRKDVIHVQIKGPGVDQGWVRDENYEWSEQYNHISA